MFHGSKMQTDDSMVCMDGRINRSILSVNHIRSINQSIYPPTNQPTNQPTKQPIKHIIISINLSACLWTIYNIKWNFGSGWPEVVCSSCSLCNLVKLAGEGMTGPKNASFCNFAMTSVAASWSPCASSMYVCHISYIIYHHISYNKYIYNQLIHICWCACSWSTWDSRCGEEHGCPYSTVQTEHPSQLAMHSCTYGGLYRSSIPNAQIGMLNDSRYSNTPTNPDVCFFGSWILANAHSRHEGMWINFM